MWKTGLVQDFCELWLQLEKGEKESSPLLEPFHVASRATWP